MIALTFANEVHLPPSSRDSLEEHFQKRVSDWSEELRNVIEIAGVEKEIAEAVPIIPTSYRDIPLPTGTTDENWLSTFWGECLRRSRFTSMPAVLKIRRDLLINTARIKTLIHERVRRRAVELKQVEKQLHIQEQCEQSLQRIETDQVLEQGLLDQRRSLEHFLLQTDPAHLTDSILHAVTTT